MTPRAAPGDWRILRLMLGASLVLSAVQCVLGASPVFVLLNFMAGVACLVPPILYGFDRMISVVAVITWLCSSFNALLMKTILLQPLDSNLFEPFLSEMIVFAGSVAFALAAITSSAFKFGVLKPVTDPKKLRILSVIFAIYWLFSVILRFGGPNLKAISVFIGAYIAIAFICETGAVMISTNGRRIWSLWSLVLAATLCAWSVASNSKSGFFIAGGSLVLSLIAFRVRPSLKLVLTGVVAWLLLSNILFPAIHIARALRDRTDPVAMAEATLEASVAMLDHNSTTYAIWQDSQNFRGVSDSLSYQNIYLGARAVWVDRFIVVGYVDAVARRMSFDGPFHGWAFLIDQIPDALPVQFNKNKSHQSGGDQVTQALDLTPQDTEEFPTVPWTAETFYAGGFVALFLIGIASMTVWLGFLQFLISRFTANVWAIYFILQYFFSGGLESFSTFVYHVLRQWPIDVLLISGAMVVTRFVSPHFGKTARAVRWRGPTRGPAPPAGAAAAGE